MLYLVAMVLMEHAESDVSGAGAVSRVSGGSGVDGTCCIWC